VRKKIVYFSFYFNLKIVRFFYRTLYNCPPEDEHKVARNMFEDSNKHIIKETVGQVGHLSELYEDARSEKYIK